MKNLRACGAPHDVIHYGRAGASTGAGVSRLGSCVGCTCNAALAVATTQSINRNNTTHQVQQQAKDAREPALALWNALVCAAHCRMLRVGNDGSGLLGVW